MEREAKFSQLTVDEAGSKSNIKPKVKKSKVVKKAKTMVMPSIKEESEETVDLSKQEVDEG